MKTHYLYTTVDVTPSGVRNKTSSDDWMMKRNQQRNFDTLVQVISLRSQPLNIEVVEVVTPDDTVQLELPDDITKIWRFRFDTDREGVFGDEYMSLLDDLNGVPYVPGLTETINNEKCYFIPTVNVCVVSGDN